MKNLLREVVEHKLGKLIVFGVLGIFGGVLSLIVRGVAGWLGADAVRQKQIGETVINYYAAVAVGVLFVCGIFILGRQLRAELSRKPKPAEPPLLATGAEPPFLPKPAQPVRKVVRPDPYRHGDHGAK